MYLYIYDALTEKRKYSKVVAEVEKRITDLGINGRILRLKEVKDISKEIEKEAMAGLKNIVVVGNDSAVHKTINAIASAKNKSLNINISLGLIPLGKKEENKIATALGIDQDPDEACEILLARRILNINIGKINNSYFFSEISIENPDEYLEINKGYSVKLKRPGIMRVINFSSDIKTDPTNKLLDLYIFPKSKKFIKFSTEPSNNKSYFGFKKINIHNKKARLLIDNSAKLAGSAHITLSSQKIPVIVGKNRNLVI
jgi:hypothetical protein